LDIDNLLPSYFNIKILVRMANEERLRAWFESVDVQGAGQINGSDLKKALAAGNLHFSDSVAQQMIRMHDADRNGIMSFAEFVALNKFLSNVQNAYIVVERGRGFLTLNDVYEALTMSGYALDQPAFYTLCESFDETKKGRFRLDDFISLCIFVQSARNLFTSYDTTGQGRVSLDFNQFVYCAASCRI
jgi:Ca2+-binding EF-hand superfamily protein